jgi:hypothetical protein
MSVGKAFAQYAGSSKRPRVHPMIQIMTNEWKEALEEHRQPRWFIFNESYLRRACEEVARENPMWHEYLSMPDLTHYRRGMSVKMMWWLADVPEANGALLYF